MTKKLTSDELRSILLDASANNVKKLNLSGRGITELPPEIRLLESLEKLDLSNPENTPVELQNQLTTLPPEIAELGDLQELFLTRNQFTTFPDVVAELQNLRILNLGGNQLSSLPPQLTQLRSLREFYLHNNKFQTIPPVVFELECLEKVNLAGSPVAEIDPAIGALSNLKEFVLGGSLLTSLPDVVASLSQLETLWLWGCNFSSIPPLVFTMTQLKMLSIGKFIKEIPAEIRFLTNLELLNVSGNELIRIAPEIGSLKNLVELELGYYSWGNQLTQVPPEIGQLQKLEKLRLDSNQLRFLPDTLADLANLKDLILDNNPLDPILKSIYEQGLPALMAYLRGLRESEPLYEAKLVLMGEGAVGKTTLLKALSGQEPKPDEPTTHGIKIDVRSMHLAHPDKPDVQIQLNAWDFGGQEVYRVTHQFFFSRRSVYLLVWEPRMGVQQCQVDDWLKLIRLRVGDDAKVIIVSTHAQTGQRIARIDKQEFRRAYGTMIVDFVEVDSLIDDPATNEKYGIAELKTLIAQAAKDLDQMGSPFINTWRAARDELIELGQTKPCVSYAELTEVCSHHKLEAIETRTLVGLMHDLGYAVFYGDDERLKDDVILQPEWLTKAIGFVLEDRATEKREGVLPDSHLKDVWLNHSFANEPTYDPSIYPFFLRLMEKYDVSYRLVQGDASLVAQHVPQVRPSLPWLPEEEPRPNLRRLAMVYVMNDAPPGLVPWMIVRTHQYAFEREGHRLHWQKGMFLRNTGHGEAMLELRGREFHFYVEALWPEYFMNILGQILTKLVSDNWPGMQGRHAFNVPCPNRESGEPCAGRFEIKALQKFLEEGDQTYRCQVCHTKQNIIELLYGFEDKEPREQLRRIEEKMSAGFLKLESQLANQVMTIMRAMANEAKDGPRLFDIQPVDGNWFRFFEEKYCLRLWCEAENNQHPVLEPGQGSYEFKNTREWVRKVGPYATLVAGMLKTLVPVVAPAVNAMFGAKTIEQLELGSQLDLMKEATSHLEGELQISDPANIAKGILKDDERAGLLALHSLLRELDPLHSRVGLRRVATYTGDFQWLCDTHYNLSQPRIPETID